MLPGFHNNNQKSLIYLVLLFFIALVSAQPSQAGGSKAPGSSSTTPTGEFAQAEELFRAFRGFCPSHGEWVERARSSAKSLSAILVAIKDDPACKSLAGSLNQLDTLQTVLSKESLSYEDLEWEEKKRSRYEILMQLQEAQGAAVPDAGLISSYESSLRDIQVRMGVLEARSHAQKKDLRQRLVAQQSVMAVSALMQQSLVQKDCFAGRPQLFATLASLAGSVSAVALTGGASLGIAAGVELLGEAVEYSRKSKIAKKINKINEASIHESFSCALEALSNQWCGAKESLALFKLRARALNEEGHFYNGVRFLHKELPIFLGWLDKVQSGSRPNNSGEADRQKEIFAKEAALKAFLPSSFATLQEKVELLPDGSSPDNLKAQFDLMRQAIADIQGAASYGGNSGGKSANNPIFDVVSQNEFPWLLAGLDEAPITTDTQGNPYVVSFSGTPFQSFRDKTIKGAESLEYPLNPQVIERRIEFLFQKGAERLALERSKRLQVDPRDVLWAAESPVLLGPSRGVSPLESLDALAEFMAKVDESEMSANQKVIYRDTRNRLANIRTVVDTAISSMENSILDPDPVDPEDPEDPEDPFPPNTPKDDLAAKALESIYAESMLEHGLAFFSGRLRRIIRYELHSRVENPEESDGLTAVTSAQLLASQDILEELESFGTTSPTYIKSSISRSLVNTYTTSQAFAEVFAPNLTKALNFYSKMSRMDDDHKPAFYDLCLLLLAVPNWRNAHLGGVPLQLCEGAVKKSDYKHGKPSFRVTKQSYFEKHSEGRACHYRNFARREKILRDYGPSGTNSRRRRSRTSSALGPAGSLMF